MLDGGDLKPWPELSRETRAQLKSFQSIVARRRSPRTGAEHEFFLLDCRDWINVVALTDEGKVVLVRQYRHGSDTFTLEIPGGAVDPGEDMVEAGRRELREESGYEARELRYLGSVNPNPAFMMNRCGTLLATGCRRVGEIEQDPGEDLQVVELTQRELRQAMRDGHVDHALVFAALAWCDLDSELDALLVPDVDDA